LLTKYWKNFSSISYKNIIDPLFFTVSIFLLQFLFWWLFFPDLPSVADGNNKYIGYTSFFLYLLLMLSFILGGILGRGAANSFSNDLYISNYSLFRWAKFSLVLTIIAFSFKFAQVLTKPDMIFDILNTGGVNRLAQGLNNTQTGIGFLSLFWIFPSGIFAFLFFSESNLKIKAKKYFYFTFLLVLFYSILNMTRTAFITYFLINCCCYLFAKKIRIKITTLFMVIIFLLFFYWANSLLRTGILYSSTNNVGLFSFEVQAVLFQEFVEKYVAGEINNALIVMNHQADPLSNLLYGTAFHSFGNSYAINDYYLNTQNGFGFWYWQFGVLGSLVVVFLFSFTWRYSYFLAIRNYKLDYMHVSFLHYIFIFPGLYSITRINYFFLFYYLIPIFIIFIIIMFKIMFKRKA